MGRSVAVVGMACRYPGSASLSAFWENVLSRRVQFRDIPAARLGADYFSTEPGEADKTYGRRAAVLDGFEFDPVARRVPRQTAEGTDIVHWLALEVALAAVEDAGLHLDSALPRQAMGVVLGNTLTGEETRSNALRPRWPFIRQALHIAAENEGIRASTLQRLDRRMEEVFKSAFPPMTEDTLAGGLSNTIAGRICNYLDLGGGAFTVDGACSSSLLAVTVAADMLLSGRADVMLAGGVDVSIDPFELVGFAKATALSPDEMRVYDERGNGFIPGEGCGFVVLKRLEDAERDGDTIYAVVEGWGISTDGKGALTSPTISGQSLALRRAFHMADISPDTLHFIEGHGTGTAVGDRVELSAIADVVGRGEASSAARVGVTSLKSLMGHTKAAAGIGGFIKTALAVQHRMIPPTSGCDRPHAVFSEEGTRLYPVRWARHFPLEEELVAGVSAMGFGGINCHVVLRSPPSRVSSPVRERDTGLVAAWQGAEVFPLAGEDNEALGAEVQVLMTLSVGISVAELSDLAVFWADRPRSGGKRAAVVASSPDELKDKLKVVADWLGEKGPGTDLPGELGPQVFVGGPTSSPRLGFLFAGQGSQHVESGIDLFYRYPWARALISRADEIFAECGPSVPLPLSRILGEASFNPAAANLLDLTEVAQPAICLMSMLWFYLLQRVGLTPAHLAGHSLGEVTALWAAGAFDDDTLLRLATLRGQAMAADGARPGGMLALWCGGEMASQLVENTPGYCVIANYNSPRQTIVSGEKSALDVLAKLAVARGIDIQPLAVSNAFHSDLVGEAGDTLRQLPFLPREVVLTRPVHSGNEPGLVCRHLNVAEHLGTQVVKPVWFMDTLASIVQETDWLVEVGPGRILTGLASGSGLKCRPVASDGSRRSWCLLLAEAHCRGVDVQWSAVNVGRHVSEFIPASERAFYRNPCERLDPRTLPPRLVSLPSPSKSHPPGREQGTVPAPISRSVDEITSRIQHLIATQTGYPLVSITPNVRLLDHLNLDSIKSMALLDAITRTFVIPGKLTPQALKNPSVAELAQLVAAAVEGGGGNAPVQDQNPTWVESFTWKLEPAVLAPEPAPLEGRWGIVATPSVHEFVSALTRHLPLGFSMENGEGTNPDGILVILPNVAPGQPVDWAPAAQLLAHFGQVWKEIHQGGHLPGRICFVQVTDGHLGTLPAPSSQGVSASAFAASFSLENPETRVQVIDLPPGLTMQEVVTRVWSELSVTPDLSFSISCYGEDGLRRVPRLVPVPESSHPDRVQWTAGEVLLVTGGGKGITAECVLALAHTYHLSVAVLGRSVAPQHPDESTELASTLRRYHQAGIQVAYFSCDVADRLALSHTLTQVETTLGPVVGVIHGAGLNLARRVEGVLYEDACQEIGPKLSGALNLCSLFEGRPLKLFCALTSVIGVSGMAKNAWYAFANEQVDHILRQFQVRHPSTHVLSLSYSAWDEVGMGARMGSLSFLSMAGMSPIPLERGVASFLTAARRSFPDSQVVITGRMGKFPTWRSFRPLPRSSTSPLLSEMISLEPGVEGVAHCSASVEHIPALRDHDFHGSILFPTVLGMELMAEVVEQVSGRVGLLPVLIEDLELERPVIVPQGGITLEIVARRVWRSEHAEVYGVKLYPRGSDPSSPHFHATFVLDPPPPPTPIRPVVGPTLPLEPQRDLYGQLLFQGPVFQRLEQVFHVDPDGCTFGVARSEEVDPGYVLGDPFSRDVLLQAMQLVVTPEEALPVRVRAWYISRRLTPKERVIARGDLQTRVGDMRGGPLHSWGADGGLVERLVDYEAKVLHIRPDWPTPAELGGGEAPTREEVDPEAMRAMYVDLPAATASPDGPDGQWCLRLRDFVSFRHATSRSRLAHHGYFVDWMGRLREAATFPVRDQWTGDLMSGRWGLVTNRSGVVVEGPITAGDLVEGSFCLRRQDGAHGATLAFGFEWFKVGRGAAVRVAYGWMEVTWVAILGPAQVEPRPFPSYFNDFFRVMIPTRQRTPTRQLLSQGELPPPLAGTVCWRAPDTALTGILIYHTRVDTTQIHANVVGNVYYAHYSAWQAAALDALLEAKLPHHYQGIIPPVSGLRCRWATVQHLREALPFDTIVVEVYVRQVNTHGLWLEFVYGRLEPEGMSRLAVGEVIALWSRLSDEGGWVDEAFPADILDALIPSTRP